MLATLATLLLLLSLLLVALAQQHRLPPGRAPAQPPFPSPGDVFPTAWFGGDGNAFEFEDPKQLDSMRGYRAVFMSWPEMMVKSKWSNGTEVMATACEGFKAALGPNGTAVFGYNQGQVAPLFYPEVLALTKDLGKFGDYFLGFDKAAVKVTMNSSTFCSQMGIKAPYTPETENCLALYWNFCNDDAIDYYVNTVLGNMVSKGGKRRNFDGLFIDWAGNFKDAGTRGTPHATCPDQAMKVHQKTFALFEKFQMWPVFSLAGTMAEADSLWQAGVGYTQFSEYWTPSDQGIGALYNLTEVGGVPSVVHTPIIHARSPHTAIVDAVAGFLIGAGGANHSYLMYGTSWTSDRGWPWSPLFDFKYGQPLGPPTRNLVVPGDIVVWERRFTSGAVATVRCAPKSRSCPGNITGIPIW
eukprot:COSAG01_NODE_5258_length_4379_cov_23.575467_3_plen_412_part_00